MKTLIAQHGFWVGIGVLWAFSALVGGMPQPDQNSGRAYRWLYGSLHLFAANLDRVANNIKNGDVK